MKLVINTFPWIKARGSNAFGSCVSHWAKRGKWNWNISSVIYTWEWETCFLIIGTSGLCLNKTPPLGSPLNSVPFAQLSRALWKRNVAPSLPCKLFRLSSNPAIRRGLKSLNQLSVENQLWSRQVCLCGTWNRFSCGMLSLQKVLFEVCGSKYWERNQTTLCFMTSKGPGRAAYSLLTPCCSCWQQLPSVMSHVLMCSRPPGKLTAPPSLCYFCENLYLVDSASYCSTYNHPAKPQLAVISLESLLNNVKI